MITKPIVTIKKMPLQACPKTSSDFGYFYEDIIKKKLYVT